MPRARIALAVTGMAIALVGAGAGCNNETDGLSQQAISSAMPTPSDLPGGSWSVVGTTHTRPATMTAIEDLAGARGTSAACQSALRALAAPTPAPAGFARTVLRTMGTAQAERRNLTLSVETASRTPDRPARITAVTTTCTSTMKRRVGKSVVQMRLRPQSYGHSGFTGYTVFYEAGGLREVYDEVMAVQGHTMITASISGQSRADNQRVLRAALVTALGRLEATRRT